jgi:hypothetical protein
MGQKITENDSLHEQLILISGFLGGLAFTSLVFLQQYADAIESGIDHGILGEAYYVLLIIVLAGSSVASIFSCLASLPIAGKRIGPGGKREDYAIYCFFIGLSGLVVSVPMLLFSLSKVAGIAVFVFVIALFYFLPRHDVFPKGSEERAKQQSPTG